MDPIEERELLAAATAGDVGAMNDLGVLLRQSSRSGEAEQWYRRAIAAGNVKAAHNLGLLLKQTEVTGPGIFGKVTYIQRTNTTGGLAPSEPGTLNEIREIPYTAEYYFYRAEGAASPLE